MLLLRVLPILLIQGMLTRVVLSEFRPLLPRWTIFEIHSIHFQVERLIVVVVVVVV
jgi:hypothetical protein